MRLRARIPAVVLLVASFMVLGVAGPAHACSCVADSPASRVGSADAAFIGTLADTVEQANYVWEFRFTVDQWLTTEAGSEVTVNTAWNSSCAMETIRAGQQVAIFAHRNEDGALYAGLCDTFDPDLVRATLTPLTVQTDAAPSFFVELGGASPAFVLLDAAGKVSGWADRTSPGWLSRLAVCPGERVGVDWRRDGTIEVRDLATLTVTAQRPLAVDSVESAFCLDPAGTDIVAMRTLDGAPYPTSVLIDSEGVELARGAYLAAVRVGEGLVVVSDVDETPQSSVVSWIDGRSRNSREIARSTVEPGLESADYFDNFVADRTHTLTAFRVNRADGLRSAVVVVELATGIERARQEIPTDAWLLGWGETGLAVRYSDRVELWDDTLTMVTSVSTQARIASVIERDGVLYGFDGPRLLGLDLATGDATVLNVLPSQYPTAVVLDRPALTVTSSSEPAAIDSAVASAPAATTSSGAGPRRLWIVPGLMLVGAGAGAAGLFRTTRRNRRSHVS